MARLLVHAAAWADLDQIAEYIAGDSIDAALRFLDAARSAFHLLSDMPGLGTRRRSSNPALAGLRTWPIRRFRNFLVCYQPLADGDGIEVIRVLHGARNLDQILDLE